MKKLGVCVILCLVLLGSTIGLADSVDQGYKKSDIMIERETEGNDFELYNISDLAKKFKGRSEEKSQLMYPGKLNEYRRHQKRSIASSIGYTKKHYLRAYVEGFQGATDTGRVEEPKGFTLYSKWAYMRDYPVPGRARAFYGID